MKLIISVLTILTLASIPLAHAELATAPLPTNSINSIVCNVRAYGAKGDGQPDTAAIQAAVEACKGRGGIVYFPHGRYVSGTVWLGSNMTIRFAAGSELVALRDKAAFEPLSPPTENTQLLNCRRALLYAESTDGLTIEGPGTIDGSGDFRDWQNVKEAERPMAIFIVKGHSLKITNLHVRNAAMWAVVLMETDGARVSDLDIDSQSGSTRDGIDIVDGSNVHLDHLTIISEDDSICLKSGVPTGLSHVWITNSTINGSLVANGMKFGTASRGFLTDVHFENIHIQHVAQAAIALESVDGSVISGISFKNVNYQDTGTGLFVLLGWRGDQSQPKVGSISNLHFENVSGESSRQGWGSLVSGTFLNGVVYSPEDIQFKNVHLRFKSDLQYQTGHLPNPPPEYAGQYPDPRMWPGLPAQGLYFRHVRNISLVDTSFEPVGVRDARPMVLPSYTSPNFNAP